MGRECHVGLLSTTRDSATAGRDSTSGDEPLTLEPAAQLPWMYVVIVVIALGA